MSTEPNGGVQDEETVQNVDAKRLALDRALTNVVNMARRLNFSCAEGYKSLEESLEMAIPTDLKPIEDTASASTVKTVSGKSCPKRKPITPVRYTPKGSKFPKTESIPKTPRGVQCLTAHLPVPPPPPPPSPRCPQARELCLALERSDNLRIQFDKTDEVLNQLLNDAQAIDRQVAIQCQMQRDAELIRTMEVEYSGRSMRFLIEAIQEDCESQHVQELKKRCLDTLKRHEEREMQLESDEDDQDQEQDQSQEQDPEQDQDQNDGTCNGKGTQTDFYQHQNEIEATLIELEPPMDLQDLAAFQAGRSGAGDGHQGQKKIQEKTQGEDNLPVE
nr:SWI/SNF chromatin-remodeling complex subunit SNF5 [Drosophila suzukii]